MSGVSSVITYFPGSFIEKSIGAGWKCAVSVAQRSVCTGIALFSRGRVDNAVSTFPLGAVVVTFFALPCVITGFPKMNLNIAISTLS